MSQSSNNVLRFYLLATSLKNKIRQGSIYWNVTAQRRESIAEHIYDTCILAISIESEYNLGINLEKCLKMLIIHELEEIVIGDITPFDKITEEQKLTMGRKAVISVLEGLQKEEEYLALTDEFNARQTKEAKFAHLCDKLDFDLQMKLYIDKGYIKLQPELDTPIYNSKRIQKMIDEGLTKPAEIFYRFDSPRYKDSQLFKDLLDEYYSLDLNEKLEKYLKELK